MKKWYILIIFCSLIFISGCSYDSDVYAEVETIEVDNMDIIISKSFNSETNQQVKFEKFQFEIPDNWSYEISELGDCMYITPNEEQIAKPCFFVCNMHIDKEYDILNEDIQVAITTSIIDCVKEEIEVCELSDFYVKQEQLNHNDKEIEGVNRDKLCIECKGTMYGYPYTGDIIAFYLEEELYAFHLFQYDIANYDYYEDMCSIISSIVVVDAEIENLANIIDGSENVQSNIDVVDNLSKIEVTYVEDFVDNENVSLKVFIKNNSDMIFSSDVNIYLYSLDDEECLASDTIIVEELLPGRESWTCINIDKYIGVFKLKPIFSNITFMQIEDCVNEIDVDATENTKNSYYLNFEGVSWYGDIINIVVYIDGNCEITVKEDMKEEAQFYASTVWSCGSDYGVDEVRVLSEDGIILSVFP